MHTSPLRRPLRATLTSTLLCGALLAGGGAPAVARDRSPAPWPAPTAGAQEPLADGLVGPLSLAVGHHDTVYVSENFGGRIDAVRRGEVTPLVTSPGVETELGSVSTWGNKLVYTTSAGAGTPDLDAHLLVRNARGDVEHLADLGAYELTENPDGKTRYGFRPDLPAECLAQLPEFVPGSYTGGEDSHPYATEVWHGTVFVADAGGNDVLAVDRRGDVTTLAVLPPVPLTVTEDMVGALGLPVCTVGEDYLLESVPTDVEAGRDGWLYVTSLPGGPEGGGVLPALGSVHRVHPRTGETHLVARGFAGATDLAVGTKGEIYVAELFGGKVSVVPRGSDTPQTFAELPFPAAVEVKGRSLYVTTESLPFGDGPPGGKVVRIALER